MKILLENLDSLNWNKEKYMIREKYILLEREGERNSKKQKFWERKKEIL